MFFFFPEGLDLGPTLRAICAANGPEKQVMDVFYEDTCSVLSKAKNIKKRFRSIRVLSPKHNLSVGLVKMHDEEKQ